MRSRDPLGFIGFSTVPRAMMLVELNFCFSVGACRCLYLFLQIFPEGLALVLLSSSSEDWVLWDLWMVPDLFIDFGLKVRGRSLKTEAGVEFNCWMCWVVMATRCLVSCAQILIACMCVCLKSAFVMVWLRKIEDSHKEGAIRAKLFQFIGAVCWSAFYSAAERFWSVAVGYLTTIWD